MTSRISDPRVGQAWQHGCIDGLPEQVAGEVGALASFLLSCHIWSDVTLAFEEGAVTGHGPGRWRVPVTEDWWIVFAWLPPVGPTALELWHVDDG